MRRTVRIAVRGAPGVRFVEEGVGCRGESAAGGVKDAPVAMQARRGQTRLGNTRAERELITLDGEGEDGDETQ